MPLEPRTSRHSRSNALALAKASGLAYGGETDIKKGLMDAFGSDPLEFRVIDDATQDSHCFMAGFDQAIVLAFRGTVDIQNWLSDAQVALVPYHHGGLIHRGF